MSMARSGVLFARHCSRTSACRCLLLIVYEDIDCASSDNDGRGEDVTPTSSDMLRSHSVGSKSVVERSDTLVAGVSGPS